MGTSERKRPKNALFSNLVVGFRRGFDNRQYFIFLETDDPGQNREFHDVDASLAAFKTRNERLVPFEFGGQFLLAETRSDPCVDQRPAQSLLSFAPDCSRHASHTFCDVASG